jgi:hypothetical protein
MAEVRFAECLLFTNVRLEPAPIGADVVAHAGLAICRTIANSLRQSTGSASRRLLAELFF